MSEEFEYDTIAIMESKFESCNRARQTAEKECERHIGLIDMLEKNINIKQAVNESLSKTNEIFFVEASLEIILTLNWIKFPLFTSKTLSN